jgi:diamine N-acetyltransferase
MLRLIPADPDHWRYGFELEEDQKRFVADEKGIMARAYAYRACGSRCWILYAPPEERDRASLPGKYTERFDADGMPVGMLLVCDCPEEGAYDISQLLIDRHFQRRGYGRQAMEQALALLAAERRFDRVLLCIVRGNGAAERLYTSLGFTVTDDPDNEATGEYVYEKTL